MPARLRGRVRFDGDRGWALDEVAFRAPGFTSVNVSGRLGGGTLTLAQRDRELSLRIDGVELMNSRVSGSEEALATLVSARLGDIPAPHVLIGGGWLW